MFARVILILPVLCVLSSQSIVGQSRSAKVNKDFEVVVSGKLAPRLDKSCTLVFWRPETYPSPIEERSFRIGDLPAKLPFDKFGESAWYVDFTRPSEKEPLFSVALSSNLFAKPRRINIKLNAPKPQLRPFVDNWRRPAYTANISQRMRYGKLPFWDKTKKKLVPSPNVPELSVVQKSTGITIHKSAMFSQSCHFIWPIHWHGQIRDVSFKQKTELQLRVSYDSGGLFDSFGTVMPFTFHPSLHY